MKKTPSDLSTSGQLKTLERGNEEAESSLLDWTEKEKDEREERGCAGTSSLIQNAKEISYVYASLIHSNWHYRVTEVCSGAFGSLDQE